MGPDGNYSGNEHRWAGVAGAIALGVGMATNNAELAGTGAGVMAAAVTQEGIQIWGNSSQGTNSVVNIDVLEINDDSEVLDNVLSEEIKETSKEDTPQQTKDKNHREGDIEMGR